MIYRTVSKRNIISGQNVLYGGRPHFSHFSRACGNSVTANCSGTLGSWMDTQPPQAGCIQPSHPASSASSFHLSPCSAWAQQHRATAGSSHRPGSSVPMSFVLLHFAQNARAIFRYRDALMHPSRPRLGMISSRSRSP